MDTDREVCNQGNAIFPCCSLHGHKPTLVRVCPCFPLSLVSVSKGSEVGEKYCQYIEKELSDLSFFFSRIIGESFR